MVVAGLWGSLVRLTMSLAVVLYYVIGREIRRQADWWGLGRKLLGGRQVYTCSAMKLYFESALPA